MKKLCGYIATACVGKDCSWTDPHKKGIANLAAKEVSGLVDLCSEFLQLHPAEQIYNRKKKLIVSTSCVCLATKSNRKRSACDNSETSKTSQHTVHSTAAPVESNIKINWRVTNSLSYK